VRVVLIGTRKAPNVGGSARALSAFECMSLVFVAPRVKVDNRACLSTSKGAQYLIRASKTVQSLPEALQGCSLSVAFTRWLPGMPHQLQLLSLLGHPISLSCTHQQPGLLNTELALTKFVSGSRTSDIMALSLHFHEVKTQRAVTGRVIHALGSCYDPTHVAKCGDWNPRRGSRTNSNRTVLFRHVMSRQEMYAGDTKLAFRGVPELCAHPAVHRVLSQRIATSAPPPSLHRDAQEAPSATQGGRDHHRDDIASLSDPSCAAEAQLASGMLASPPAAWDALCSGVQAVYKNQGGAGDLGQRASMGAAGDGCIALVFGREFEGLTESELATCDAVCSIPLGRLQESMSLSHSVSVVLSQLFQHRMQYLPQSLRELYCPATPTRQMELSDP
jgi:tRNA C32,U32 (ribose-2'-O)-methylase TrmJ